LILMLSITFLFYFFDQSLRIYRVVVFSLRKWRLDQITTDKYDILWNLIDEFFWFGNQLINVLIVSHKPWDWKNDLSGRIWQFEWWLTFSDESTITNFLKYFVSNCFFLSLCVMMILEWKIVKR
jgi:hypothetical protein